VEAGQQADKETELSKMQSIVRVKAELQEKGLRIPPELMTELELKYNAPAVSTGR